MQATRKRLWQQRAESGFYDRASLGELASADVVAVECARRLRAFVMDRDGKDFDAARLHAINARCFLLIGWGDAKIAKRKGKIDFDEKWTRANGQLWANPTTEYFDSCVAPIVRRFTTEQLQETF